MQEKIEGTQFKRTQNTSGRKISDEVDEMSVGRMFIIKDIVSYESVEDCGFYYP